MIPLERDTLDRLYRYAYTLTGEASAAYDLLQDALERYLRAPGDGIRAPVAYLRRIMRNQLVDDIRRRRGATEEPFEEGGRLDIGTRTLEEVLIAEDELAHLWGALEPVEREILYHWAVEGLTAREIADALEMPRGTVLSRIHRLRLRLRAAAAPAPAAGAGGAP